MTLYARFAAHIHAALDALEEEGALARGVDRAAVAVEPPRDPAHGDLATNAAMVLAKRAGTNPRALAELIVPRLAAVDEVDAAEVAGPGFINIRLGRAVWEAELETILADGGYSRSDGGRGQLQCRICLSQSDWADARAIVAARWSAMRWRPCSNMPATRSPANIASTTPAVRSTCSLARRTSGIAGAR